MTLSTSHAEQHATFRLNDIHCLECADAVVQALRVQPHISDVHLDWAHNRVRVTYHSGMIAPEAIEQVIASAGCSCAPADGAGDVAHTLVQPAPARRLAHLRHGVDVQPITMGTKHDRMQYELPATEARPSHSATHGHATGHAAHATVDHAEQAKTEHAHHTEQPVTAHQQPAMDHGEHATLDHTSMGHDMAGMDHAAMGHDMSDPGMAAAMERDMRTKFFIALPLTILTVLYAPLGMNLFGVRLPTFGLDVNLSFTHFCGQMIMRPVAIAETVAHRRLA